MRSNSSYEIVATNVHENRKHQFNVGDFVIHRDTIMDDACQMSYVSMLTWRVIANENDVTIVPTYTLTDIGNDIVTDVLCTNDLMLCDVDEHTREMWTKIANGESGLRHANDYDVYFIPTYRSVS